MQMQCNPWRNVASHIHCCAVLVPGYQLARIGSDRIGLEKKSNPTKNEQANHEQNGMTVHSTRFININERRRIPPVHGSTDGRTAGRVRSFPMHLNLFPDDACNKCSCGIRSIISLGTHPPPSPSI